MKSKKILTESEKKQLHEFYYSNAWELLSKVLRNRRENIKEQALVANDMEDLNFLRGCAFQINWIENQLSTNSKNIKRGEKNGKESSK